MANAYYDYNSGSSGNDGLTAATAKDTRTNAQGVAGAGDKVIAVDGTQTMGAAEGGDTFFDFDDNYTESSESYRGATLQPEAAETTRCARSSGTITPHIIENLTFDGQANGGLTQCFDIIADGTNARTLRMRGCHLIAGDTYGFLCSKIGATGGPDRIEFVSVKLSGSPTTGLFATSGNLSSAGDQTFDLQNIECIGTLAAGTLSGINITKINNLTNTLDVAIKGITGTFTTTGTASVSAAINVKAVDPIISNVDISVDTSASTGNGNIAVIAQGQTTAIATNPKLSNIKVDFNSHDGYAIALGQSTTDAYVTGGEMSGCEVTGRYFTSDSPHGILMGQGLSGATVRGCTSKDIYAGYLASKCTSGTMEGNLAFDCYGVSYYIKGTTAITVQDNTAVVTGKWDTPTNEVGVLAVAPQDATNTAGALVATENMSFDTTTDTITTTSSLSPAMSAGDKFFIEGTVSNNGLYTVVSHSGTAIVVEENLTTEGAVLTTLTQSGGDTIRNLVIVADVSKINALAYIEDANQYCTFSNNTYIIPDTVDVSTANLFTYENGIGGAANNTLAQWNAQTEVTDDVIVQLPQAEIAKLIATLNPSNNGATVSADGSAFWRARQV